jgi:ABC-type sugar transport system ATPase subunit
LAQGADGHGAGASNGAPALAGQAVVRCVALTKWFGGVQALRGVSLDVHAGRVLGLVGDNGAGKSTLVKILSGLHRPDGGEIWLGEERLDHLTPHSARDHGIETVYQDLALCENLDAVSNVVLGQEPTIFSLGPVRIVDRRAASRIARERLAVVGAALPDLGQSVRRLSGGQRQAVAIARATMRAHRLIMFDEPTAALGIQQTQATISLIRGVADQGVATIVISHNMEDVFAVADRIVVLRLGNVVLDTPIGETSREEVMACITMGRTSTTAPS